MLLTFNTDVANVERDVSMVTTEHFRFACLALGHAETRAAQVFEAYFIEFSTLCGSAFCDEDQRRGVALDV